MSLNSIGASDPVGPLTPAFRFRLPGLLVNDSLDLEFYRRLLPAVALDLILDRLSLIQRAQARLLNGRYVNEHVPAAASTPAPRAAAAEPPAFG